MSKPIDWRAIALAHAGQGANTVANIAILPKTPNEGSGRGVFGETAILATGNASGQVSPEWVSGNIGNGNLPLSASPPPGANISIAGDRIAVSPKFTEPWVDAYAERRAIMLEDGGASEAEAHRQAFWEAVGAWEAANPITPPAPGACVACGYPVRHDVVIEVKDGGAVYQAHSFCGQRLHMQRRAAAERALAAAGIRE